MALKSQGYCRWSLTARPDLPCRCGLLSEGRRCSKGHSHRPALHLDEDTRPLVIGTMRDRFHTFPLGPAADRNLRGSSHLCLAPHFPPASPSQFERQEKGILTLVAFTPRGQEAQGGGLSSSKEHCIQRLLLWVMGHAVFEDLKVYPARKLLLRGKVECHGLSLSFSSQVLSFMFELCSRTFQLIMPTKVSGTWQCGRVDWS